jgi:epoxide hydrolase 4
MQLYDHLTIETNGINLHVVQAGDPDAPLVILLHGFPEFWYGWRKQIPYLAKQGFRVWAPDQRGYNISDKPPGIRAYNLDVLTADVLGLIEASGREKVHLVGHDWGGAIAWFTALKYPERLEKLVILNAPHHDVFRQTLMTNGEQRRKSWYAGFFQLPVIPEWICQFRSLASSFVRTARPGTFSPDELREYQQAWSQPGALTAMINYYRAVIQAPPQPLPSSYVLVPTLMIWGKGDVFLSHEMAQPSIELCDNGRLIFIENATHWVQHEEPEQVNHLMVEFLSQPIQAAVP